MLLQADPHEAGWTKRLRMLPAATAEAADQEVLGESP